MGWEAALAHSTLGPRPLELIACISSATMARQVCTHCVYVVCLSTARTKQQTTQLPPDSAVRAAVKPGHTLHITADAFAQATVQWCRLLMKGLTCRLAAFQPAAGGPAEGRHSRLDWQERFLTGRLPVGD